MHAMDSPMTYQRVLLKLSGESLFNFNGHASPHRALSTIIQQIGRASDSGVQLAVVLGGGNICRGRNMLESGAARLTADNVGMLATVINALVFKDLLQKSGISSSVYSAFAVANMVNIFDPQRAIDDIQRQRVVICCGGTGNPLVSTDTAASLRAIQLEAQALFKLTNVDGVYDCDPTTNAQAKRYQTVSYEEVIEKRLKIMDAEAFRHCQLFSMPIHVAHYEDEDVIARLLGTQAVGTKINATGE